MQLLYEIARDEKCWNDFLDYKIKNHHLSAAEEKIFREYIDACTYKTHSEAFLCGEFPATIPVKRTINKEGTKKKRVVYSYDGAEGIFLKFVAWQLFRYDSCFSKNCYAFRRSIGVRDAIMRIRREENLSEKYCLKVDISNYFNSIDVEILMQKLAFLKEQDFALYQMFERILTSDLVMENGELVREKHGAMAGVPTSPFLANIYLAETDAYFEKAGVLYFRYSDDILLFADTKEELLDYQKQLYDRLQALKLDINPEKVKVSMPGEDWEFLGFGYRKGEIDLSDNTLRKTKAKIKRKANALRRWQRRKGLSSKKAAIGLIHTMNLKFFGFKRREYADEMQFLEDDFNWCRWFLPNLTTDRGLREIDRYLQEYIRYAVTGRHYKGNYRIRYETLKEWGYESLVHEYWKL